MAWDGFTAPIEEITMACDGNLGLTALTKNNDNLRQTTNLDMDDNPYVEPSSLCYLDI